MSSLIWVVAYRLLEVESTLYLCLYLPRKRCVGNGSYHLFCPLLCHRESLSGGHCYFGTFHESSAQDAYHYYYLEPLTLSHMVRSVRVYGYQLFSYSPQYDPGCAFGRCLGVGRRSQLL